MRKLLAIIFTLSSFVSIGQGYVVPRNPTSVTPFTAPFYQFRAPGGFVLFDSVIMFKGAGMDTLMKPLYPAIKRAYGHWYEWDSVRWALIGGGDTATHGLQFTIDRDNVLTHDNIIKNSSHSLVFDTASEYQFHALNQFQIWHHANDGTPTAAPQFLVLKNDSNEAAISAFGAQISGSAAGGAIIFHNSSVDPGNEMLRLGLIDNNNEFTEMMQFHYSQILGDRIIAPFVESAEIGSVMTQHGDTLYKTTLAHLADSLAIYINGDTILPVTLEQTLINQGANPFAGNYQVNFSSHSLLFDSLDVFGILTPSYSNGLLYIGNTDGQVRIGDRATEHNGNYIDVNDIDNNNIVINAPTLLRLNSATYTLQTSPAANSGAYDVLVRNQGTGNINSIIGGLSWNATMQVSPDLLDSYTSDFHFKDWSINNADRIDMSATDSSGGLSALRVFGNTGNLGTAIDFYAANGVVGYIQVSNQPDVNGIIGYYNNPSFSAGSKGFKFYDSAIIYSTNSLSVFNQLGLTDSTISLYHSDSIRKVIEAFHSGKDASGKLRLYLQSTNDSIRVDLDSLTATAPNLIGQDANGYIHKYSVPAASSTYVWPISYFTPTTGGTVTAVAGANIIEPAGTLATLTVNVPTTPSNGTICTFTFVTAITALTFANGTFANTVTSSNAGGTVSFIYRTANTTWYKWQ